MITCFEKHGINKGSNRSPKSAKDAKQLYLEPAIFYLKKRVYNLFGEYGNPEHHPEASIQYNAPIDVFRNKLVRNPSSLSSPVNDQ
jgi:hypothetical protein